MQVSELLNSFRLKLEWLKLLIFKTALSVPSCLVCPSDLLVISKSKQSMNKKFPTLKSFHKLSLCVPPVLAVYEHKVT